MKRIGVLTHYYENLNYGGCLQSYALVKYLNKLGFDAEQICYPLDSYAKFVARQMPDESRIRRIMRHPVQSARSFLLANSIKERTKRKIIEQRKVAFSNFRYNYTPHSSTVYNHETIGNCLDDYDIFVTGSDQVWNFTWYNPAFFLNFVPSEKTKVAYAASIGNAGFSDEQKVTVKDFLKDFDAISVREDSSISIISELTDKKVYGTIDPTLLLTRDEWDEVCTPRLYDEEYVFCYFLGTNSDAKRRACEYAKKHALKTVYIPYASDIKDDTGEKLSDILPGDISPEKFISLIKHSRCVFTDSFHAIVFSYLYDKHFFVFHRSKNGEMSARIYDFINLIGEGNRFCCEDSQVTLDYFESVPPKQAYNRKNVELLISQSTEFIKDNIV